jgi:RNA recognition motif-containing protein
MTTISVGNLSAETTEGELEGLFSAYGTVERVSVDGETATVEMADAESAAKAIQAIDGRELSGRQIKVNEAGVRKTR